MAALLAMSVWYYSDRWRVAQTAPALETARIVEMLRSRPGVAFVVETKDGAAIRVMGTTADTRGCRTGSHIALDRRGEEFAINPLGCRVADPRNPNSTLHLRD